MFGKSEHYHYMDFNFSPVEAPLGTAALAKVPSERVTST